ncbi:NADH-quinone oxidoreductase subunit NuoN [Lichenicola cladoniae]|uniref:NADH-quinone oxidoreductase subunit N n=1 Tax=Lichenicola cladoniae TaxID=1484109 RepID=A0A6M8HVM9_9PROT|nr:NADH-quinone oxidoreductase subunit NuoN [Lichenicola cladoniae]NPD67915.1 NADH-quinone oxidoreductase subunit NuoN [Acetobacteraceae bacterium]QKE92593.1 NADH-quinone oxidoreductase subunit NuoN [Lichenicola cladoniae]
MNWTLALPEIFLSVCGLAILVYGVLQKKMEPSFSCTVLALAAFVVTAVLVLQAPQGAGYRGTFVNDGFARFMKILSLAGGAFSAVLSLDYNVRQKVDRFEFPVLLLFATVGTMMMASSENLMTLYVGLELQSLAIYILCAFARDELTSAEAGLKYFVLGSLASGLLLYGISLVYGFAGTMEYVGLKTALTGTGIVPAGLVIGIVFVFVGLAFKLSAAPFHMWTPDVYQGAPTSVTAFMAGAPKVAAFALLLRVMAGPFGHLAHQWQLLVELVAIITMITGALAAIPQTNIKRLMAYSSIGHMGYAMIGVAVGTPEGARGTLVYLTTYLFMTTGVFACIMAMRRRGRPLDKISDLAGLSRTDPMLALLLAVFMFSMAGVPPLSGFFGKLMVFAAAVQSGLWTLAVIGILTSVVGLYYYWRVVKVMYLDAPDLAFDRRAPSLSFVAGAMGLVTALFLLVLGPVTTAAQAAAGVLFR